MAGRTAAWGNPEMPASMRRRWRPPERRLIGAIPYLALLIVGCACAAAQRPPEQDAADDHFEQITITTGTDRHQVVLPGRFRGADIADLAVISTDRDRAIRLRIYALQRDDPARERATDAAAPAQHEGATRILDIELPADTLLVDAANLAGRDRIILYAPGRLSVFDPDSKTISALAAVDFGYTPPRDGAVHFADLSHDVNGDGLDDLLLPGRQSFTLFVQREEGLFSAPLSVGPPEPHLSDRAVVDDFTYGQMGINPISIPWYLGRVHRADLNLDGRIDLVFLRGGQFDVHLQDERGMFDPEPASHPCAVPLDSDGEYSLQYGFSMLYSSQTALHTLDDLNRDGVADMITMTLAGFGLLKGSAFGVHFGAATPEGVVFRAQPDTMIRSSSVMRGLQRHDLDGDGLAELKFSDLRLNAVNLVRALGAGTSSYILKFHRLDGGVYPEQPTAQRTLSFPTGFSPPVLIGDVTGDGRADLLAGRNRKTLRLFVGIDAPELFNPDPVELAVSVPPDDESSIDYPYRPMRLYDFNGDGRQDVLVHHVSATAPHRVTVLLAR